MNPAEEKPARPKGGVVVPHRPKWHGRIAARVIWLAGRSLEKSWRVRLEDRCAVLDEKPAEPVIFALWHNRLAVAMTFWGLTRSKRPAAGLAALISASRDGGLLAQTFQHFGVTPVRGSSSRRGAQALRELTTSLRQGYHVAITPDGPRGPKYVVQPGIVSLAQLTGAPIVPAGAWISSKKCLRSWDRFQIPLPFARCELIYGEPITVGREASEAEREAARARLEAELRQINRD